MDGDRDLVKEMTTKRLVTFDIEHHLSIKLAYNPMHMHGYT